MAAAMVGGCSQGRWDLGVRQGMKKSGWMPTFLIDSCSERRNPDDGAGVDTEPELAKNSPGTRRVDP